MSHSQISALDRHCRNRIGWALLPLCLLPLRAPGAANTPARAHTTRMGDVMTIEGVRDNPLVGYGLVVGLNRTGDSQQTFFSSQTLASSLRKMGVQLSPTVISQVQARDAAAVFITALLPPFARPGEKIDVTVATTGDAKSLAGGILLLTPLYGPDGKPYAVAEGALILGGYTAGPVANSTTVNHPTSGRIPSGAIVEEDTSIDLSRMTTISLLLRQADFSTAEDAARAINEAIGTPIATVIDSRKVDVNVQAIHQSVPSLMAKIENLTISIRPQAKVVVNERTGTVVMGQEVRLGAATIMHGNLAVDITTTFEVSQPEAFSLGKTTVVPQVNVQANESQARRVQLREGATVDELVNGLLAIGATARDIAAILEALKAAGSLQAELEVI